MPRTLFTVPDMGERMRQTDPYRRKKTPQDLEAEARDRAIAAQLTAQREGRQFQGQQSELDRAVQERAGRLRALTSVAAAPGAMQSAAAQQLMGQGGDGGETYEQRVARARQAYSDKVGRSDAAMAQGQAKQNQLDAARIGDLGKQGIDPRRMVWQAPGGQERSLSGQDTELSGPTGRTPEAYSQMVGTQGDLARQYPPKPAVNVIGLSKLQEATRQVAFPNQATAPAQQLTPDQYEQVRGSFAAGAPVREPYTEGPGTEQGRGPAIPASQDQQLGRLQTQANRASGPGLDPIGMRIAALNDPKLARNERINRLSGSSDPKMLAEAQKLKAEKDKEVYALRTELEQTFPDAMDREAYIRGMGLSKFMGLSERPQADRGASPEGRTILPIAGYNEGMTARTIDAGAPMTREDALKQYMARVQGQGQQAAGAETAATERLAQTPYAAPGTQGDPMYDRMIEQKYRKGESDIGLQDVQRRGMERELTQGPQPTPLDTAMSEKPLVLSSPSAGYGEAWDSWGNRSDLAANTVESQISGVQNETLRKQKALEVQSSAAYDKYLQYSAMNPDDEQALLDTFLGPWMPGRGGRASGMLGEPDRKAIIANARKLILNSRRIVGAVNAGLATSRQPTTQPAPVQG